MTLTGSRGRLQEVPGVWPHLAGMSFFTPFADVKLMLLNISPHKGDLGVL